MNNINNFKNFLKTSSIHAEILLNEDLNSLKKQYFSNMSLGNLLRFALYSPDWNETMQQTTLTLEFPTAERRDTFAAAIQTTDNKHKYLIYDDSKTLVDYDHVVVLKIDNAASATLTVTFPEKQFGLLAKSLKQKGIKFVPKRNKDLITFSGSDLDLKNIFIVWSVLTAGDDPTKVSVMKPGDELPEQALALFNTMVSAPEKSSSALKVTTLYYYTACSIFYFSLNSASEDDAEFLRLMSLIANASIDVSLMVTPPDETKLFSPELLNKFYDSVFVMNNISETTRFIVNLCYNEIAKSGADAKKTLAELDSMNIASRLYEYLLQAKESNEKDSASKMKNIMQIKTLSEFKKAIAAEDSSVNIKQYALKLFAKARGEADENNDAVAVTNKVAKRRLKLFEDATKTPGSKPAEVISNDKWIFALTYSSLQNGIWGRYKPKVDSRGNILSACNMRDDEVVNGLRITPENKRIRDDPTYRWVRDGIGADDNNQESDWCTTGAAGGTGNRGGGPWGKNTSSYWSNYNNHGRYPYVQMMELATGMMYLLGYNGSSYTGFLFESEYKSNVGLVHNSYGDTNANLENARKANPKFNLLMLRVDEVFNKKGFDADGIIAKYKRQGEITKNGRILIKSRSMLLECLPYIKLFTGIVIDTAKADSMFANVDCLNGLPPIDMKKVTSAVMMFNGCRCENIQLLNTNNIKNTRGMFLDAKVTNISGLDTSSSEDMSMMFFNTVNYKNPAFYNSVNALDVSSCKNLNGAFAGSNFRKIALQNTDNVETADSLYQGCVMLLNFPTVEFKSIKNLKALGAKKEIEYPEDMQFIFSGCTQLQKAKEFDLQIKKLYDFYIKENKKEFLSDAEVDERGFIVINSADDVDQHYNDFNKYPGVVINMTDATWLFSKKPISIKTLDLGIAKDISYLFSEADILMLNEVINEKNTVTKADFMFNGATFSNGSDIGMTQYPTLNFPNVNSAAVFGNAPAPRKLSDLILSYKIDDLPDAVDAQSNLLDHLGQRIFKNVYSTWCGKFNESMMREYIKSILKSIYLTIGSIQDNISTTENGYLKIDSNVMWKLLFNMHADDYQSWLDSLPGIYIDTDNASKMFLGLKNLNMPNIDMERVTNASHMFESCYNVSLKSLENCGNILDATNMFSNSTINNFPEDVDFSSVTNGINMFYYARIKHHDNDNDHSEFAVTNFSSLEDGSSMFYEFNTLILNIDNMQLDHLARGNTMFEHSKVKMTKMTLPNLTTAENMFYHAKNVSTKINRITCLRLQTGYRMFAYFTGMNDEHLQLNNIEMPNLTNANSMFMGSAFEKIGTLNLPIVRRATDMFRGCRILKMILRPKFRSTYMDAYNMFKNTPLQSVFKMHGQRLLARIRALHGNVN